MDEKRKPYVTISFRQPRLSRAILAMMLSIGLIAGAFGIEQIQRWHKQMQDTEARLHETEAALTESTSRLNETEGKLTQTTSRLHELEDEFTETTSRLKETETRLNETEAKLQETEVELLEAKKQVETYLPISPLNEPIAFWYSSKWGIDAAACMRMPNGYWTPGWGHNDGAGRVLFYFAREWDTVEAIQASDQYTLVGEEWSEDWDDEEGVVYDAFYTRKDVLDSRPFIWSKSKGYSDNRVRWEARLRDYCRELLQP